MNTLCMSFSVWVISVYFLVPSIFHGQNSNVLVFNSWMVFRCVNDPNFLYPFLGWRMSSFQFLTIMNKAAMNILEQVLLWDGTASFGYLHRNSLAGSYRGNLPNFLNEKSNWFTEWLYTFTLPSIVGCSPCATSSSTCSVTWDFDVSLFWWL